MTEKIKAYSYLRISTDAQRIGDGVRRQMDASKKYAEENDYQLVETIKDIGVSGFSGKNADSGAFSNFLAALDAGEVQPGSVLIVESLDRLSRNQVIKAFSQFTSILSKGVTIITLIDGQVYTEEGINTNPGQLFATLGIMVRANDESETKSKRISAVWKKKRDEIEEKKMTKTTPAWLVLDDDRKNFTVRVQSAKTVREIFDFCVNGMGVYSITRHLNGDLKRYPPISNATKWNDSYVAKILRNAAVCGQFQPHQQINGKRKPVGEPVTDYFPKIVSEETFYLAKSVMKERRVRGAGRKGEVFSNLFSGLLKCGACGGTVNMRSKGKPPKGYTYLRCNNSLVNNGCRCPAWRYSEFEEAFYNFVKDIDFSEVFSDPQSQPKIGKLQNLLNSRRMKRDETQLEYDTLVSRFEIASLSNELLSALVERAEDKRLEIETIENEIEALDLAILSLDFDEVSQDQSNFIAKYETLESSNQKDTLKEVRFQLHGILRKTVDKIFIYNGGTINPWDLEGNISAKLTKDLEKRGISSQSEIEKYFNKPAGKRLFNHSARLFVVRFKNETARVVHPYENVTYQSVSEKLARFRG